jgi:hypothetical protein
MQFARDVNVYGAPISVHLCEECGVVFTVCPPTTDGWGGCLAKTCPSYDPGRDADRFFDQGLVKREGQ